MSESKGEHLNTGAIAGLTARVEGGQAHKSAELASTKNAQTTLVVFGGIANGIDIPPFEFRRITDSLLVNKVFLRDTTQGWYQAQVKDGPFAGLSYEEAQTVQGWLSTTKTVFIGNSMGGFAAIMFGALFGADRVLAFAPQTFISPFLRLRCHDYRWVHQILRIYARHGLIRDSYDLRTILTKKPMRGRIDIFCGEKSRYDATHAAHLSDLSGVTVTVVPGARHGAAKRLRERGELTDILRDACAQETANKSELIP